MVQIFGRLKKHELKSFRLVCKTQSDLASEPLIDKLYMSPREEDIIVFNWVTQYLQLRRCVRKLGHDAIRLSPDLSTQTFSRKLIEYTSFEIAGVSDQLQIRQMNDLDAEIDDYFGTVWEWHNNLSDSYLHKKCKHYNFVVEGYRSWQKWLLTNRIASGLELRPDNVVWSA